MKVKPLMDMLKATRLTREGRLADALAVIRERLTGSPAAGSDPGHGEAPRDVPHWPQTIDMEPPTSPGDAWTAPGFDPATAPMPDALRDFLDRVGRTGPLPGQKRRPEPSAPPIPDGARFEERSFANGAGSRTYKLYVPSGYDGRPLPLVVMLHGCTQSPDDFAAGTRMNDLAEEEGFFVAYPAQSASANTSRCWNWFNPGDQRRERGEPSIIAGITREIMREFSVEPGRVYVAGLSAGGAKAAIMGAAYPDLYAAVGVHSGLACGAARDMPSAFAAMRQGGAPDRGAGRLVPTIVFHGDGDRTVNPVNGDQVIAQAGAGSDLRLSVENGEAPGGVAYTRTVQSDEDGHPMLEKWVLHGAGHAWSGGSPAGSYTDSRGPDASREMLRFFRAHPKP